MENASKALLIAGAILIAILLIAVGMMIYNGSSGLFGQATSTMGQQEKQAFNGKFEIYEGGISGSNLKSLVKVVNLNNADEENSTVSIELEASVISNTGTADKPVYSFVGKTNQTYEISFDYTDGIISNININ